MNQTLSLLQKVSSYYNLSGSISEYNLCTNGHINGTYYVKFKIDENTIKEYIFQKINSYVFKDPIKVMHNIKEVSNYLQDHKIKADCNIRTYLNNKDGRNYTIIDNDYWRICNFIKNSVTYETVANSKVLYNAGYAFGSFQNMLSDFPMDRLFETIPNFHNTKKRIKDFFDIVALDPIGRAKDVSKEIFFLKKHKELASKLVDLQEHGLLPLRVTHNDTKYNNILMDKDTGKPLCVIDIDTIMPGLAAYDFGDAIRFAANTAVEDETDLSKVGLNIDNYEEFTKGFMKATKSFLTKNEVDTLALGSIVITIELASRFLADHINGDKYFRIHRENHNLDRARCQLKLAEDMIDRYDEMCTIVQKYAN